MNLWVNQLLEWHTGEATGRIKRLLWIDEFGTDVVTIELSNSKAIPIWQKCLELEAALAVGEAHILQVDPYAELLRSSETISEHHRIRRDSAWKIIAPLVDSRERLFIPQQRGPLIAAAVESTGCTKRTIYKYLRRY